MNAAARLYELKWLLKNADKSLMKSGELFKRIKSLCKAGLSVLLGACLGLPAQSSFATSADCIYRESLDFARIIRGPIESSLERFPKGEGITSTLKDKYLGRTRAGTLTVKDAITPNGRYMHYEWIRPVGRQPTVVIGHGLGDSLVNLDSLADEIAKSGKGVLRVDWHGHGESYRVLLARNGGRLPLDLEREFYYRNNTRDLEAVIQGLRLNDIAMIGHSYGGGMIFQAAQDLSASHIRIRSLTMVAPYLQRIDGYYEKGLISGHAQMTFLLDLWNGALRMGGVDHETADQITELAAQRLEDQMSVFKPALDQIYGLSSKMTDDIKDNVLLNRFLENAYSEYFAKKGMKEMSVLPQALQDEIERRTQVAIATTKASRSFDLLHFNATVARLKTKVILVYGRKDKLVPLSQGREFQAKLLRLGYSPGQVEFHIEDEWDHLAAHQQGRAVHEMMRSTLEVSSPASQ